MQFEKSDLLNNFDIFPKVVVAGKPVTLTMRALGDRFRFAPNTEYRTLVCALNQGQPRDYPKSADFQEMTLTADENGEIRFTHTFTAEQEYHIRLFADPEDRRPQVVFSIYCVAEDLAGRYPYIGDLHVHTLCSDGHQTPEVVCANYRAHGYDFMAITDHKRYYPSLRAIEFYRDVPTELNIVPGEEIHLPPVHGATNDVHIVNFGGEFSVNSLIEGTATEEVGTDPKFRTIRDEAEPVMTLAEYEDKLQAYADAMDIPEHLDRIPVAVCKWIFEQIRRGNGLGIFAHPYWRSNVYQVPDDVVDYFMENREFDAFEVLGGENYFEQNGFQTVRYYEDMAKGHRYPIVGSTDTHNSYEQNRNAFICSTIVFSPANERTALIKSVKDYYSVAVDTISKEFRLVGESRLVRYGCFLLKHFFPIHDEVCFEEGRLMKQVAVGTPEEKEDALATLKVMHGRVQKLREKYFAF